MIRKTTQAAVAACALLALTACGGTTASVEEGKDGVKMGHGVSDDEIRVGIFSDYSGPIAEGATSGSLGGELAFDAINEAGGICGRKVVAVKADTKYDPQQTTQVYRAESKDVLMISQLLGTASINAIKANIARDGLPSIAISLNTTTLKEKDIYVPVPTFEIELINGLVWAAERAGASESKPLKVGVVTASDEYGDVYADAVKSAAETLPGVEVVANPTYTVTDKDFTAQVSALKDSGAQVVLLGTSATETGGIVGVSAQLGYKPTWIAESGAWLAFLADPLKGLLDDFYVSGGYGTIDDDDVPGIKELKAAAAKYAPEAKHTQWQVGGWLMGKATIAALQAACDNEDLTREGVKKAMEDLKISYDGITPDVDLGNGDTIVSYSSRMNSVNPDGGLKPLGDFYETDAAKAWGADNGF